jgi:hypothetical protein
MPLRAARMLAEALIITEAILLLKIKHYPMRLGLMRTVQKEKN